MSILPAGSVTRRDGVLDIAAHTPRNANPPDLGPKGYFAQASDDRKGAKGTTKLHSASLHDCPSRSELMIPPAVVRLVTSALEAATVC